MGLPYSVQQLRCHAANTGGVGLIPGQGTQIPCANGAARKKKQKNKKRVSQDRTLVTECKVLKEWKYMMMFLQFVKLDCENYKQFKAPLYPCVCKQA